MIDLIIQGICNEYTIEIIKSYLNLDFINKIIISCWENNETNINDKRILIIKSLDINNPGLTNRNRQIKTSLEGLKLATTDFSVKLRSDQKISLDGMKLMFDFYEKHKEQQLLFSDGNKPNNQICVAGIFKLYPFHPRDHIFWGNTQDLIELFSLPYDNDSQLIDGHQNYNKNTRAETYIGSWYCSKFDNDIIKYCISPDKYLFDNAPEINKALEKSNWLTPKVFRPFPRINFEWPKYGLKNYHYNITSSQFGEYWND